MRSWRAASRGFDQSHRERGGMVRPMWCADSAGLVSTSMGTLKLIVRKSDSYARYVILHSAVGAARSENILSSGSEANVQAAIEAAEKVATRIGLILAA